MINMAIYAMLRDTEPCKENNQERYLQCGLPGKHFPQKVLSGYGKEHGGIKMVGP
jgi:hypothetical protein